MFEIVNLKLKFRPAIVVLALFAVAALLLISHQVKADTVSQAFNSGDNLVEGSVVSLNSNSAKNIQLANTSNSDSLLGVVVVPQNALVNLNSNIGNTQVVTNGQAKVMVSDINGVVKNGDLLTASPISGIAMKATLQGRTVGTSIEDFDKSAQKRTETVKDKAGKENTVSIALINANVVVSNYSPQNNFDANSVVNGIKSFAFSASGKPISTVRAVVALLVLLVAVVVSIIILYTTVLSSIRSIGRNPLSKHAILQSLVQVIAAIVVIMASGFLISYLIITR